MTQELRILIVEDLASDAELMAFELRRGNLPAVTRRADNEADFLREVAQFRPHLILSDYSLPSFDGLRALALAQEHCPYLPFIFVSGAIGEEVAIDSLKRGATDYVLKDRLLRLVPAVTRALREAAERQERHQAEADLRESEQRYRLLVGSIPAVVYKGYLDWSVDFIDNKIEEFTGYPRAEFESRRMKWVDLVLPEDVPGAIKDFWRGLKSNGAYSREFRIRTKDGRILWLQDRGQMIFNREGDIEYVSGVFFDASEAQRAKMALQESERRLRFLTSQLMTAQEQERKRISMELHDELGQSLTVMKLQIRAIEGALQVNQPEMRQEFEELRKYLDGTIENVRRLSRDLSPAILEDLGLLASLKYLLEGLGKRITVKPSLEVEDLNRLFPLKSHIIIYRIFQECLNNIAKHAGVCQVSVAVQREGEAVTFSLEDDGVGFNVDQVMNQTADARGLGLAAINERVRMLGGTCKVWSQTGAGTKVIYTIPVSRETEKSAAS